MVCRNMDNTVTKPIKFCRYRITLDFFWSFGIHHCINVLFSQKSEWEACRSAMMSRLICSHTGNKNIYRHINILKGNKEDIMCRARVNSHTYIREQSSSFVSKCANFPIFLIFFTVHVQCTCSVRVLTLTYGIDMLDMFTARQLWVVTRQEWAPADLLKLRQMGTYSM